MKMTVAKDSEVKTGGTQRACEIGRDRKFGSEGGARGRRLRENPSRGSSTRCFFASSVDVEHEMIYNRCVAVLQGIFLIKLLYVASLMK